MNFTTSNCETKDFSITKCQRCEKIKELLKDIDVPKKTNPYHIFLHEQSKLNPGVPMNELTKKVKQLWNNQEIKDYYINKAKELNK